MKILDILCSDVNPDLCPARASDIKDPYADIGKARKLLGYTAGVSLDALGLFGRQFASRAGEGIEMAVRAVGSLDDPEEIAASCELLANDLLAELER